LGYLLFIKPIKCGRSFPDIISGILSRYVAIDFQKFLEEASDVTGDREGLADFVLVISQPVPLKSATVSDLGRLTVLLKAKIRGANSEVDAPFGRV